MATKTISITEEAYKRLAALRERKNESFSEVINRISMKASLKEIYGILSGKKGVEFEKNITESRKIQSKILKNRTKKMMERFN